MSLWKLTLAYDGTSFCGWQIQPGLPTIQGSLSQAILHVTGERVLPQGSGRTDAGVHALAQVASFALACAIPAGNLHRALNHALPPAIRVLAAEAATPGFHARHSALRKTYEYRVFPAHRNCICPPFLAPWVWSCPLPLDLAMLQRAASHILGTHDFSSFAASDPDRANTPLTPVRTVDHSCWQLRPAPQLVPAQQLDPAPQLGQAPQLGSDLLVYTVTGSGFLHHMVRNLVGTFAQAGAGRLDPAAIPAILAARSRSAAGPTAPASGLFLVSVDYAADPTA